MPAHGPRGAQPPGTGKGLHLAKHGKLALRVGQKAFAHRRGKQRNGAARLLKLRRKHPLGGAHGHRKRHKGGRHVQRFKAAGHAVLAANRRDTKAHLRVQRAQQAGQRLAPAGGVFAQPLKIFLKGQICFFMRKPAGNQLCNAFGDGKVSAVIRALVADFGRKAVGHAAGGIGLALQHR